MEQLEELSREDLIQMIIELRRLNERLQAEIEQLKRRGGAAPFSKGKPKQDPKPPGRKPGQGYFRFRAAPESATASEPMAVPVAEACCPDCGGQLGAAQQEIVSITDVPAQPQPEVHRYEVEVRRCRRCGSKVRGRHPGIAAGQTWSHRASDRPARESAGAYLALRARRAGAEDPSHH